MMITITFCMINSRCSIMSLGTRSSRRQLSYEDEAVTSSASDTRGQVTIHSCALCKVQHEHMSYVQTWKSVEACKLVAEKGITPKNLICRPCRDDVCRMVGNPDYVPRWEKRKERVKCCIKDCTAEVSHVFSNIYSYCGENCCPFLKRIIFILRETQFRFRPRCVRVTITQSTSQSSHSKLTAPPVGCPLSM